MMGGSLAKAIKHKKLSKKIYGYDVNKKSLSYAKKSKIINDYDNNDFNYLSSADLIIICAPISAYKMILKTISNYNLIRYCFFVKGFSHLYGGNNYIWGDMLYNIFITYNFIYLRKVFTVND